MNEKFVIKKLQLLFNNKYLLFVPNCNWTGHECDILGVTPKLKLVDLEVKLSIADFKRDIKKYKWYENEVIKENGKWERKQNTPLTHPPLIWKHYYVMPHEIWKKGLEEFAPSDRSGIILLNRGITNNLVPYIERQAKPNKDCAILNNEQVIDIARLANIRMWSALSK